MINKTIASLLISSMIVGFMSASGGSTLEDTDIEKYLNQKGFNSVELSSARDSYYKVVKQAKTTQDDGSSELLRKQSTTEDFTIVSQSSEQLSSSQRKKTSQTLDDQRQSTIDQENLTLSRVEPAQTINEQKESASLLRVSLAALVVIGMSI